LPAAHSVKVGDSEHDKKSADRVVKAEGPAEPDGGKLCDEEQRAHDRYGPPEEFRRRGCHGGVLRCLCWQRLAGPLSHNVCGVPVSPGRIPLTRPLLVLGVRRLRTPECGREFSRRGECRTARASASRLSTAHDELLGCGVVERRSPVLNMEITPRRDSSSVFAGPLQSLATRPDPRIGLLGFSAR